MQKLRLVVSIKVILKVDRDRRIFWIFLFTTGKLMCVCVCVEEGEGRRNSSVLQG